MASTVHRALRAGGSVKGFPLRLYHHDAIADESTSVTDSRRGDVGKVLISVALKYLVENRFERRLRQARQTGTVRQQWKQSQRGHGRAAEMGTVTS
jgi:hypothetical protein